MASEIGKIVHCKICGAPIEARGNRLYCPVCYNQNRRNAAQRSNARTKMEREQTKREEAKMKENNRIATSAAELNMRAKLSNLGGISYVSFRVAVNRGQNKDESFIPVRAPKKFISDTLRAKLTKGASVLVFGRFESGHYEKDGQKKFYDYLSAATIQHDVNGGFSEGLLMGNLTADVVTRNTRNGGTMVTFTVASNRSYQKNGNWENATSYVSCAASGKTAEFIAAHFHKGDPIMLVGVLTSNQYQNKDGQNRTSYTLWVEKASFASRKNASQNDDVPAVTAAPAQAAPAAAPAAPAASAVAQPSYGNYTGDDFADIDEDDLPF